MMIALRRLTIGSIGAVVILAIALVLGAMPLSTAFHANSSQAAKTRIFVLSNGFHSDIAIPKSIAEALLPIDASDYPVDPDLVHYYAVGWGSETAFTSLLAVSDLTMNIIVEALFLDEAVIHVTPLGQLQASASIYVLDLDDPQVERLGMAIRAWFSRDVPIDGVSQGFGDRFYRANGNFSPWHTCNSWTGRRLREAGIAVGTWTPLAQSLGFGLSRYRAAQE